MTKLGIIRAWWVMKQAEPSLRDRPDLLEELERYVPKHAARRSGVLLRALDRLVLIAQFTWMLFFMFCVMYPLMKITGVTFGEVFGDDD